MPKEGTDMPSDHRKGDAGHEGRRRLACALALLALLGALALCWKSQVLFKMPESAEAELGNVDIAADEPAPFIAAKSTDLETLHEEETSIDLSACEYECLISDGGYYRLSGQLIGRVRIDAEDQYVHIALDGATIESREGPAVYVQSASKVVLTLADGSKNSIADSASYRSYHDTESCIFSECDLTINGSGALTVKGFYKDAIRSRDVIRILGSSIDITCSRTGVHAADGILLSGGSLTVSSRKNAFKTTRYGPDGRGSIDISGGTLSIIAGEYAFVTYQGNLYIRDCTVRSKSVIGNYDIGGEMFIESGCVR